MTQLPRGLEGTSVAFLHSTQEERTCSPYPKPRQASPHCTLPLGFPPLGEVAGGSCRRWHLPKEGTVTTMNNLEKICTSKASYSKGSEMELLVSRSWNWVPGAFVLANASFSHKQLTPSCTLRGQTGRTKPQIPGSPPRSQHKARR